MDESPLPEGPAIVDSDIKQTFAAQLTLLDQRGSTVTFGDMQVLPIGNSLVYVRPWFVAAANSTPVPELRYVTVTYERKTYQGSSLEDALAQTFPGTKLQLGTVIGGTAVVPPPDTGGTGGEGQATTTVPPSGPTTSPPVTSPPTTSVEELLQQSQAAYDAAQAALKAGDLGLYQQKMNEAYRLASQAASQATGTTVVAVPSTTTPGAAAASPGDAGAATTTTVSG